MAQQQLDRPLPCFDLGGVIIRICRTWREGAERAGVPWRDRPAGRDMAHEGALHRGYQSGTIEKADYYRRLSAHWQGAYSPDEIDAIHRAWLLGPYPGVTALLAEIAGPTAILSNTCGLHWDVLLPLPAVQGVTHALASHEIGAVKPLPAAFAAVEQATGRRDIVFFDDAQSNIDAARAFGWQAVLVDPNVESTAPALRASLSALGLLSG